MNKAWHKHFLILIISIPLICFFCLLSVNELVNILERLEVQSKQSAIENTAKLIPTFESQFNQMVDQITHITKDNLIEEHRTELFVSLENTNCIIGRASLDYGTDRLFEEVTSEYRTAFTKAGWSYSQCKGCSNHQSYFITTNYHIALVFLTEAERSSQELETYSTYYYIFLTFGEPTVPCLRPY